MHTLYMCMCMHSSACDGWCQPTDSNELRFKSTTLHEEATPLASTLYLNKRAGVKVSLQPRGGIHFVLSFNVQHSTQCALHASSNLFVKVEWSCCSAVVQV